MPRFAPQNHIPPRNSNAKKTDLYYRNEYIAAKLQYRIFFIPEATCLIPLNGALMS